MPEIDWKRRAEKAEQEAAALRRVLDTIERRLSEGIAPGQPWGNERMALQIVREERARAEQPLDSRAHMGDGEGAAREARAEQPAEETKP